MRPTQPRTFPTLASILSDTAPPPWTLDKFVDHLVANHCLETLEFIRYSSIYRMCYEQVAGTKPSQSTTSTPRCEQEHLRSLWVCLIDTYIAPNGKREVNLPFNVKARLLATRQSNDAPNPSILDSAVGLVYDLIESSMMVSFVISPIPSKPEIGGVGQRVHRKSRWTMWWDDVRKLKFRRGLRRLSGLASITSNK